MPSTPMTSASRGRSRASRRRYPAIALSAGTLLALGAAGAFGPVAAQAAVAAPKTLFVSQGGLDKGTCPSTSPCASVSYALTKAAPNATIEVSGTIHDKPSILQPVTITTWPGGPAKSPGVIDGAGAGAVVTVNSLVTGVTIENLTLEGGSLGLFNSEGTVTLIDSTVTGNATHAEPYAGIWNYVQSTLTIIDSTITKNSGAGTVGAGIDNNGVLTVIGSTISGNTGGGIYSGQLDTASLAATIVANNTGQNCGAFDAASLDSAGYNLTSDKTGTNCSFTAATDLVNKNPLLGHLADNGGPTRTLLPAAQSPAADVIPAGTSLRGVEVCPATDQRGAARPGSGETGCTVGATEAGLTSSTTTSVTVNPKKVKAGARVIYLAVVTPKTGSGTPAGTISFTIGSTSLCTAVLVGGVAACGATSAPVGAKPVTGTYSGGNGFAKSSGTATLTVTKS